MLLKRLATAASLTLACLLTAAPALAIDNGGYSHDSSNGAYNPNWLGNLADGLSLSQLSLPGTHDTMAFYGGDIPQAQSMPLLNQLNAGVRVLDIRCNHYYNSFYINHGPIYQFANFDDVLGTVKQFLQANPRETVLMRVKEEWNPSGDTREFWQTFQTYQQKYPGLFWNYSGPNPTLGQVRGKVVVLQNFSAPQMFGIDYNSLNAQDNYVLSTNWDLYNKWTAVKNQLNNANNNPNNGTLYINYLSGSTGSFPYFVASGQSSPQTSAPQLATGLTTPGWNSSYPDFPRVACFWGICTIAFEGTDKLTAERLGNYRHVGILMADFPGKDLINGIIAVNYR
jgi:1-phosphatidylinositol phosphodiesterase